MVSWLERRSLLAVLVLAVAGLCLALWAADSSAHAPRVPQPSEVPAHLRRGQHLRGGSELGKVGDSGAPGNVHVHLETRRLRAGVDAWALAPQQLIRPSRTIACDPRNVFPLREAKVADGARE